MSVGIVGDKVDTRASKTETGLSVKALFSVANLVTFVCLPFGYERIPRVLAFFEGNHVFR